MEKQKNIGFTQKNELISIDSKTLRVENSLIDLPSAQVEEQISKWKVLGILDDEILFQRKKYHEKENSFEYEIAYISNQGDLIKSMKLEKITLKEGMFIPSSNNTTPIGVYSTLTNYSAFGSSISSHGTDRLTPKLSSFGDLTFDKGSESFIAYGLLDANSEKKLQLGYTYATDYHCTGYYAHSFSLSGELKDTFQESFSNKVPKYENFIKTRAERRHLEIDFKNDEIQLIVSYKDYYNEYSVALYPFGELSPEYFESPIGFPFQASKSIEDQSNASKKLQAIDPINFHTYSNSTNREILIQHSSEDNEIKIQLFEK